MLTRDQLIRETQRRGGFVTLLGIYALLPGVLGLTASAMV